MDRQDIILTVDDSVTILAMLSEVLKKTYKVYPVNSGERAIHFLEKITPDIILLDVEMPGISGYDLLAYIKNTPKLAHIPVIFLTGKEGSESETKAFELGAVDYVLKPINQTVLLARVRLHLELEAYRKSLERLVEKKTYQLSKMQETTLNILAHVTDSRDKDTGGHIRRTSSYACCIMDGLLNHENPNYRIDAQFYDNLRKFAPLHDIGKVSIPDYILLKPGTLTSEEFEIMKTHTTNGGKLLRDAMSGEEDYSFLNFAYELATSHHEKWNGTGYPKGLKGEEVPLCGRIMAIADVYDALTTVRTYKSALPHQDALDIMISLRAIHFDPVLLDIFVAAQNKITEIKTRIEEDNGDD